MKSLIVFTLLIATAFAGSSQVTDLLDKLDDLLIDAHSAKNIKAIETIEDAIDTVSFAAIQLKNAEGEDVDIYQAAIDDVEDDLPAIEKLVKSNIKSRNWFTNSFKFVASKVKGVVTKVNGIFNSLSSSGLGGLISVFQPYIDMIKENPQVKGVIAGLKTVEQGIASLNKMTGGAIGPLNTISDVLSGIDSAGDIIENMSSTNSSEGLADALINTLANSKSGNLQKIEKGLDYVCNGLADAAKSA